MENAIDGNRGKKGFRCPKGFKISVIQESERCARCFKNKIVPDECARNYRRGMTPPFVPKNNENLELLRELKKEKIKRQKLKKNVVIKDIESFLNDPALK